MERGLIEKEIEKIGKELDTVTLQIQNSDYNIAGLIQQKTRHMDRRDLLETKKAELEAELAGVEPEQPLE